MTPNPTLVVSGRCLLREAAYREPETIELFRAIVSSLEPGNGSADRFVFQVSNIEIGIV